MSTADLLGGAYLEQDEPEVYEDELYGDADPEPEPEPDQYGNENLEDSAFADGDASHPPLEKDMGKKGAPPMEQEHFGFKDMDPELESDLNVLVSGLGKFEADKDGGEDVFQRTIDTLEYIKDIRRLLVLDLRINVNRRDVFGKLGQWCVMRTKMLPLLKFYREDRKLIFELLKVMVMMTDPPHSAASELEKTQQHQVLHEYKDLFLNQDVLAMLMQIVAEPLSNEGSARTDDDCKFIELVLHLFKNLLLVPDAKILNMDAFNASGKNHLTHMHDELLLAFDRESVLEMLLIMTQDIRERRYSHWGVLILEMLATIFRNKTPELILEAARQQKRFEEQREPAKADEEQDAKDRKEEKKPRSKPKIDTNDPLYDALQKDRCRRATSAKACAGARHSRFTGAFRTDGHKGFRHELFETKIAPPKRRGGRKKPLMTPPKTKVNAAVAKMLIAFSEEFIAVAYNPLLQVVMPKIIHQALGILPTDTQNFCEVNSMLLTLHCTGKSLDEEKIGQVAHGLEPHNFTFLLGYVEERSDPKAKQWHMLPAAMKCLKAMLSIVLRIDSGSGVVAFAASKRLLLNLTYDNRLLDLSSHLAKDYDIANNDKHYLTDVVGVVHHLMKMIDSFANSDRAVLVKKKGKAKKATSKSIIEEEMEDEEDHHAETTLDLSKAVEAFSHPKTMNNYVLLMKDYADNLPEVNHHITRMWHRVVTVEDGRNLPILYQLATLSAFHKVLTDPYVLESPRQDLKALHEFCASITRRFFRAAVEHHAVFVEPVLQKTSRKEIASIAFGYQDEYERHQRKNAQGDEQEGNKPSKAWSKEEDAILNENYPRLQDKVGVMQRLSALLEERSAQQVARRLTTLGLRQPGGARKKAAKAGVDSFASKSLDQVETEAVQIIDACERVATHRGVRVKHMQQGFSWLHSVFKALKGDRDDALWESVRHKAKKTAAPDYVLVPLKGEHWDLLKRPWADRVLNALGCSAPKPGEGFWRVAGSVDDRKVELVLRILEGWLGDHEISVPTTTASEQDGAEGADEVEDVDDPEKSWDHVDLDKVVDDEEKELDADSSSDEDDWGDATLPVGYVPETAKKSGMPPARKQRSRKSKTQAADMLNNGTAILKPREQEGGVDEDEGDASAWEVSDDSSDEEDTQRPKKRLKKSKAASAKDDEVGKAKSKKEARKEKKAKEKKKNKEKKVGKWKDFVADGTEEPTPEDPDMQVSDSESENEGSDIDKDAVLEAPADGTEPESTMLYDNVDKSDEEAEDTPERSASKPPEKRRLKKRALDSESESDDDEPDTDSPATGAEATSQPPSQVETTAAAHKRRRALIEDSDDD